MDDADVKLDRLLHAAGSAVKAEPEMPFGFETRVAALARTQQNRGGNGFAFGRLLQRVAIAAIVVAFTVGGAAWWQVSDSGTPIANAYAIADNAIETGVLQ